MKLNITIRGIKKLMKSISVMPSTIDKEMTKALLRAGYAVEEKSKRITPVLTGRLRSSIRTRLRANGKSVEISPHTQYAYVVHEGLGTSKRKGRRPYMERGLENARPQINRALKNIAGKIEARFIK